MRRTAGRMIPKGGGRGEEKESKGGWGTLTPDWTLQFQFLGMPAGRAGQTIEQLLLLLLEALAI